MNFNSRIIKYVYEDIMNLYNVFGYNEFTLKDTKGIKLYYSLKKHTNYGVIDKSKKVKSRIQYKLSKRVVNVCKEYITKHDSENYK